MNDGGNAFPTPIVVPGSNNTVHVESGTGMTLRDYFAAQALTTIAGNDRRDDVDGINYKYSALRAYKYADAMLAERGK